MIRPRKRIEADLEGHRIVYGRWTCSSTAILCELEERVIENRRARVKIKSRDTQQLDSCRVSPTLEDGEGLPPSDVRKIFRRVHSTTESDGKHLSGYNASS
jgi:hypothetical protein